MRKVSFKQRCAVAGVDYRRCTYLKSLGLNDDEAIESAKGYVRKEALSQKCRRLGLSRSAVEYRKSKGMPEDVIFSAEKLPRTGGKVGRVRVLVFGVALSKVLRSLRISWNSYQDKKNRSGTEGAEAIQAMLDFRFERGRIKEHIDLRKHCAQLREAKNETQS